MEELSDAELAELKQLLVELEEEVALYLAAASEGAKPVDLDDPIGRLSRMGAMQQQQMARANRQRMQSQVRLIAQAFDAIESGDYGFCRVCDEPIGVKRLRARPESPVCLVCQASREKQQRR